MFSAGFEIAPDALQIAVERLALFGGETGEERCDPFGMVVEQVVGRLPSQIGQHNADFASIFQAGTAGNEAVAFKAIEKPGDRGRVTPARSASSCGDNPSG